MATSAFRSTTRRTPIAKSSSSSVAPDDSPSSANRLHRRSRSLSRFSRPLPPPSDDLSDDSPAVSRGRFVNTLRGSGFPEVSLDDLAIQFFSSGDRGRSAERGSDVSGAGGDRGSGPAALSQRRGRSVSRQGGSRGVEGKVGSSGGHGSGRVNPESNSRRKRSVSVVRYQISDSESDLDQSRNASSHDPLKSFRAGNSQAPSANKAASSNHRQGLRRSLSQRDLKYHDDYSSQSSALTDDEGRDGYSSKHGIEKIIRPVYSQEKVEHPIVDDMNAGLYEVMQKELRHAVEEIWTKLEQRAMGRTNSSTLKHDGGLKSRNSDVLQAVSTNRRNYSTKLEQSQKHKQDLLAEILLEEQRGRELSKIVKELRPDPIVEKPMRARKRSNDRSRMSKRLTEEAEKYIEDFISNVEDTDISSLDGERSDTSSTLGGMAKSETFQSPMVSKSIPVEMDGVVLPWLKWETSNDASPLTCKNEEAPATPINNSRNAAQEANSPQDFGYNSVSSRGSCNAGVPDDHSTRNGEVTGNKFGESGNYSYPLSFNGMRTLQFDVDEYHRRHSDEDFLYERWKQQQRIHSGGLLLCNNVFY